MSRIELVPATPAHVGTLAARMRPDDIAECAAFGRTPKQALRLGLTGSISVVTAKVDGKPEAMFGVTPVSAIDGRGCPWMLGTDAIYRNGRALIAMGPDLIARYRHSTPNLSNVVGARNVRAIRLLKRWGFSVGEEVILVRGVEFLTFSMES